MEFCYPEFHEYKDEDEEYQGSEMVLCATGKNSVAQHPTMLMDNTIYRMVEGSSLQLRIRGNEIAVVLIEGKVRLSWEDNERVAERPNPIDYPGTCLHVCRDVQVTIASLADNTEILIQSTENPREFPATLYTPEKARVGIFGEGQFQGKALRRVTTYFDIHNAPYSNMVCGEIVQPQGGWSSYPPHEHPHPEVYYYRFDKPQGFGACFLDDDVYKIRDRSFAAIEGGKYHPQVTAPGYAMMYVWMIRHFDGYPWDERNFHPEHQWLLNS
ncbi:MAG: 5-deoxy-glucuronate isomerase [Oscillospiraceae bacterium]|nr:5-deoxy-glucuronate isomerase [Oscillospiraceae bacterium]